VLAPWPAFYAAVGLGSASMAVYVPLVFALFMFVSVQWLNYFNGAGIIAKAKKVDLKCSLQSLLNYHLMCRSDWRRTPKPCARGTSL
jgi:hypothetical protein